MMLLTLQQRYSLIDILPQQGDIVLMRRTCELRDALLPTEAEDKEFGIGRADNAISCNPKGRSEAREIKVGETMRDTIIVKLTTLSEEGKLTILQVPLYEKFVAAEKPTDSNAADPAGG